LLGGGGVGFEGAGGAASGTTGAGALLIMRVKSLGPVPLAGAGAPPMGESGVAPPPCEKMGGGTTTGAAPKGESD
jgi:hypothetical protein